MLVTGQLLGFELGVVDGLGQAAALAQAVEQFGMSRMLGQPRRLQSPQGGEGRIVERQPAVASEHRHRVADLAQGKVMGSGEALQILGQLMGIGNVLGPHPNATALQRVSEEAQGAAAARQGGPARAFTRLSGGGRLPDNRLDAEIQGEAAGLCLGEGRDADGGVPGLISPHRRAVGDGDPGWV